MPDKQVRKGVPVSHVKWAARYFVDKRPGVIVDLGDHTDFPSLSSHSKLLEREGERLVDDLVAGNHADRLFYEEMKSLDPTYQPVRKRLGGNHENRLQRVLMDHPWLVGLLAKARHDDGSPLEPWACAKFFGWSHVPFLCPWRYRGFVFQHYFPSNGTGRAIGGNAQYKLSRIRESFVQGHVQGIDLAMHTTPTGRQQVGIVAGSFYQHKEPYIPDAQNNHWRGIVMMHEVHSGACDPMTVSMGFLRRRYS